MKMENGIERCNEQIVHSLFTWLAEALYCAAVCWLMDNTAPVITRRCVCDLVHPTSALVYICFSCNNLVQTPAVTLSRSIAFRALGAPRCTLHSASINNHLSGLWSTGQKWGRIPLLSLPMDMAHTWKGPRMLSNCF